jgi:serine/threonine-protein kinase
MSPEQATGDAEPDPRSDIYSLGAVAYFVLTGRAPFEGNHALRIIVAHARDDVVPPSRFRPDVPADLEHVVLRCLAKRPEDRYPDVVALGRALAGCQAAREWTDDDAAQWWQTVGNLDRFAEFGEEEEPESATDSSEAVGAAAAKT